MHVALLQRVRLVVNPELLRRLAWRLRLLMLQLRTDVARRQLGILEDQLEEKADEIEKVESNS
jgi:hypothetical protein